MTETQGSGHYEAHGEPSGLSSSADGLTLQTAWLPSEVGKERSGTLEFRIVGLDGRAVRDLDEQHDRAMHLMVVRRDLIHYRHLHPSMGEDGTWSVPLTFTEPGAYRVFADFVTAGRGLTLGDDLHMPGGCKPAPLPDPVGEVRTEGYEVALASEVHAGGDASLVFGVSRAGWAVGDLDPYLGALGHLVALREGDLAFLHVHPETEGGLRPADRLPGGVPERGQVPPLSAVRPRGRGPHGRLHRRDLAGRDGEGRPRNLGDAMRHAGESLTTKVGRRGKRRAKVRWPRPSNFLYKRGESSISSP